MTQEKIALVTGASRGIGLAIAIELATQGYVVIGTATSEVGCHKFKSAMKIQGYCKRLWTFPLDLGRQESILKTVNSIQKDIGSPQILVNNAGVTADNLMLRMSTSDWSRIIDINLSGVFYLSQALLKPMIKERWGRIVNLSSVVAITGNPGQCNYTAAKAGVLALTKSLAVEVASRGITVNAVAPGFIATDMTNNLTNLQKNHILKNIPMNRMGDPKDIANTVAFLISDRASYITGETIHVNGGMLRN